MTEQLFDILDSDNSPLYHNLAYDAQCHMYYWPESNGFVTDDQIRFNHWSVINGGQYDLPSRYNTNSSWQS